MLKSLLAVGAALLCSLASQATPEQWLPIEKHVAAEAAGKQVTIVHFWAPWCGNCKNELSKRGWTDFVSVNPDVKFVFVTVWHDQDGKSELAKYGLGEQANFTSLHHPQTARSGEEKMKTFMDLPVSWTPTTWVYRDGKLRYALNYGEVRFPLLQQLVRDAAQKW